MTPDEHYAEAERLITPKERPPTLYGDPTPPWQPTDRDIDLATVHALLANVHPNFPPQKWVTGGAPGEWAATEYPKP